MMRRILFLAGAAGFFFAAGSQAGFAQASNGVTSVGTPAAGVGTPVSHRKKKKAVPSPSPTPQVTVQPASTPTPFPSPTPTPQPVMKPTASRESSVDPLSNAAIYDRLNMPGDFRRALSLAVTTLDAPSAKRSRSVFMALAKVSSNKSDEGRKGSYARLTLTALEWGGPRNPWILLAGKVYDQKGDDLKVGDPVELALDFRDVKIDYDGNKLGEIQKGSDLAAQLYEQLNSHASYQLVLTAREEAKDSKNQSGTRAFLSRANEGYAVLDFPNSNPDMGR